MVPTGGAPRRDARIVGLVLVVGVLLTVGWLSSGRSSAPDDGLLQIDMLTLHETVPGVTPITGKPTIVVLACGPARSLLPERYGVVVHVPSEASYRELAAALGLPEAARRCQPGYALVDRDGFVRYRSYDPGWAKHADEQAILLDAL
jgi:hypothetical protein